MRRSLLLVAFLLSACGNDKPVGNAEHCKSDSPGLAATPELDSLVLVGSSLLGLGGYGVLRMRASRRR